MLKLNRIPTKAFLKNRGVNLDENSVLCSWCGVVEEDSNHLFISCRFSVFFWKQFCNWWKLIWPSPRDIDSRYEFCFQVQLAFPVKMVWLLSVAAALWSLWIARNEKIFQGKITNFKDLIFQTKIRALLSCKAFKDSDSLDHSLWWLNLSHCLLTQQSFLENSKAISREYVTFHVAGIFKLDGAGCGGTLHSKEGHIIALFSGPVQVVSSHFAVMEAVKCALEVLFESNWVGKATLKVELQSQVVLNWIMSPSLRPGKNWEAFESLDKLTSSIINIQFVYRRRERTSMADVLANMGSQRTEILKAWW
ncbi:hypothetical protein GQ457_11G031730 [Hibiscus cannabinus]